MDPYPRHQDSVFLPAGGLRPTLTPSKTGLPVNPAGEAWPAQTGTGVPELSPVSVCSTHEVNS